MHGGLDGKGRVALDCSAAILLTLILVSCSTIGINRGQINLISTAQEVEMGNRFADEIAKQYTFLDVPGIQHYVGQVGARLAAVSDRTDIEYHFTVIDDKDQVNAFALPGGWVYVHSGLLNEAEDESELAAVLAHEIGHVAARHHTEEMTKLLGYSLLMQLVLGEDPNQYAALAAELFGTLGQLKFSRNNELEADELALRYLARAGYSPEALLSFLDKLHGMERREPSKIAAFLSTHPIGEARVDRAREAARQYPAPASSPDLQSRYEAAVRTPLARYYGSSSEPTPD
jgi:predicted Zn-dependent protease